MSKRGDFRSRLKQPDEFESVTEQAVSWVRENPSRAGLALGAVVVLLLGVWGSGLLIDTWRNRGLKLEGEASALYQEAKEDRAKLAEAQRKLQEVYAANQSPAGQNALYQAANLFFQDGNYSKALELYRTLADKHRDNAFLYPLVLRNMASAHEQLGNTAEALKAFQGLLAGSGEFPAAQVHLDLARIYEKTGDAAKARAAYQEIVDSFPKSPFAAFAREKLGLPPENDQQG